MKKLIIAALLCGPLLVMGQAKERGAETVQAATPQLKSSQQLPTKSTTAVAEKTPQKSTKEKAACCSKGASRASCLAGSKSEASKNTAAARPAAQPQTSRGTSEAARKPVQAATSSTPAVRDTESKR